MSEVMPFSVITGLAAGALLGGLYFGGLWWSVRRIRNIEHKKLFLFFSWLFRSVVLCGGLFLLAHHDSQMLLGAAAGLLTARFLIVRIVKQRMLKKSALKE